MSPQHKSAHKDTASAEEQEGKVDTWIWGIWFSRGAATGQVLNRVEGWVDVGGHDALARAGVPGLAEGQL